MARLQKTLSTLIVVQIALGIMLFLKLEATEARLDAALKASAQNNPGQSKSHPMVVPAQMKLVESHSSPDESQLRQIIREELVAVLGNGGTFQVIEPPTQEAPEYDDVEMQYRRELALVQIENLKSQFEVSSGELERLMGDIAKLNPENRIELFKLLNQALNRGEIKGRM